MDSGNIDLPKASWADRFKSWPLYLLPHHLISRVVLKLTRLEFGSERVIRWFVKHYKVDLSEALIEEPNRYPTFNAFFTRELKPESRPITTNPQHVACPADGTISAIGHIEKGQIFQAKGKKYTLIELLGCEETDSIQFSHGSFATIYLSPRNYHRVHMPQSGCLRSQTHIPGRLFSVAPHTVRCVPRLFARNERLVCQFDTSIGAMAMVLVGAINVAAIETVWAGVVTPPAGKKIKHITYPDSSAQSLAKGDEMGRFNMGSTVILLFEKKVNWLTPLRTGISVKMGQAIAEMEAD